MSELHRLIGLHCRRTRDSRLCKGGSLSANFRYLGKRLRPPARAQIAPARPATKTGLPILQRWMVPHQIDNRQLVETRRSDRTHATSEPEGLQLDHGESVDLLCQVRDGHRFRPPNEWLLERGRRQAPPLSA